MNRRPAASSHLLQSPSQQRSEAILEDGDWAMERACSHLGELRREELELNVDGGVGVNLPREISDGPRKHEMEALGSKGTGKGATSWGE